MTLALGVGDRATVQCAFYNSLAVLADPVTVTLQVRDPLNAISTYLFADGIITKTGVGLYQAILPVTTSGLWMYRWVATGNDCDSADQGTFDVTPVLF